LTQALRRFDVSAAALLLLLRQSVTERLSQNTPPQRELYSSGFASGSNEDGGDADTDNGGRALASKYMTMPSTQRTNASAAVMYPGLTITPSTLTPGQARKPSAAVEPTFDGRSRQALWYSQIK
jgi:hypothetical protein